MIGGHRAPGLGGELVRQLHAGAEAVGLDEGRNPAVAEAARAPHRRLAVAADPQRHRLLHRPRPHGDAVELPELSRERHLVLRPQAAHDDDRLVGAAAALLERHAGRLELAWLVDSDPEGGQHASRRQIVDHRDLARKHGG
jgi:hypothetical protein